MADSYTTLNTMLMANHIPPETAEQIICDTLRFLQFQSICDTLRADRNKYIRWLSCCIRQSLPVKSQKISATAGWMRKAII